MTKKELLELNALFTLFSGKGKTKFKYTSLQNVEKAKSQASSLLKIEEDIKEMISEFSHERDELIKKYGKEDNGFVMVEISDKEIWPIFEEKMNTLIEKHKTELDLFEKNMEEFRNLISEEVDEVPLFKPLNLDDFPEDGVLKEQLELLEKFHLIVE